MIHVYRYHNTDPAIYSEPLKAKSSDVETAVHPKPIHTNQHQQVEFTSSIKNQVYKHVLLGPEK